MPENAGGTNYSAIDIGQLDKLIRSLDDAGTTLATSGSRFRPEAAYFGLRSEVDEILDIGSWAHDQLPDLRWRLELAQEIDGRSVVSLPIVSVPEPIPPRELALEPVVVRSTTMDLDLTGTVEVKLANGMTATVEQLSDGRYRVRMHHDAGIGYGIGLPSYNAGVIVDSTAYGVGYNVGVQAMLSFAVGDVFYVDSLDEAQEMLTLMMIPAPARQAGNFIADGLNLVSPFPDLPTFPEPDEYFVEAGVELNADMQAWGFIQSAGVKASLAGLLGATVRNDGTSTAYFKGSLDFSAGVSHAIFGEAGVTHHGNVMVEVDLDENGEPVALRLRHGSISDAYAGDRDPLTYQQTTHEIPLDWDKDQQLVADALAELTGAATEPVTTTGAEPGTALEELLTEMSDRSYTYRDTYSHESREDGFFANAAIPIQGKPITVGASADVETVQRTHTGREFWNGEEWVPIPS